MVLLAWHTRFAQQLGLVIHVDMAPRVAVIAAVLAVALVGVAAADDLPRFDLGSSWTPTPESFAKWMSEGGEAWTGEESVPEMRQKFIRRVLSWATDEITDVKHDVRGVDARRCWLPCLCGWRAVFGPRRPACLRWCVLVVVRAMLAVFTYRGLCAAASVRRCVRTFV